MAVLSFLNKSKTSVHAGLLLQENGISLALLDSATSPIQLKALAYQPGGGDAETLERLIRQNKTGRSAVHSVLPLGTYQLLLVDMPKVPANEIKHAVRWQIKDLIDFHIDDAVIDVFDAPPSGAGGAQEQVYVVVTRSSQIQQISEIVQQQGLSLEVIDIPELALRNIASRLPDQDQGIALMYLEVDRGVIALCRDNTLYLARTIELGHASLLNADPDQRAMVVSSLALEVQRTMDYYDRYYQQAPINQLYIAPTAVEAPGLVKELHSQVGLNCQMIGPDLLFPDVDIDPGVWAHAFLAVGAALREEGKAL